MCPPRSRASVPAVRSPSASPESAHLPGSWAPAGNSLVGSTRPPLLTLRRDSLTSRDGGSWTCRCSDRIQPETLQRGGRSRTHGGCRGQRPEDPARAALVAVTQWRRPAAAPCAGCAAGSSRPRPGRALQTHNSTACGAPPRPPLRGPPGSAPRRGPTGPGAGRAPPSPGPDNNGARPGSPAPAGPRPARRHRRPQAPPPAAPRPAAWPAAARPRGAAPTPAARPRDRKSVV